MGLTNTHWAIYLYLLLLILPNGNYAASEKMINENNKELNVSRLPSMDTHEDHIHHDDDDDAHIHTHHATSSMHMQPMGHMDPSLMVFFLIQDLKIGNKIPIYFPRRNPLTSPKPLTKQEANSIPFSSKEIPYLLNLFSFSQNSPQAKAMEDTLRQCEAKPIKGETKFCATSRESMLEFTSGIFGLDSEFRVMSTTHLTKSSNTKLQNYTILKISQENILGTKVVGCHTMPYAYAIYSCHYIEGESKVFKVLLEGELGGERVEAVGVCHVDTSQFSPNHVVFKLLPIKPGLAPVCHFFPADDLLWVQVPTIALA